MVFPCFTKLRCDWLLNGHKVEQANDKYLADSIRRHSNGGSDIEAINKLQAYQTMIRERYYLKR
jgi:hypothetical protein